jgi:hypothetical protein
MMFAIEFDRLPYAFLLMVVNELHEWNHSLKAAHGPESCFNLLSVDVARAAGRRVINLSFIMQPEQDSGTLQALRDQMVIKRRKLANLNYGPASQNCDEVEIHADYQAGGEPLGAITVLLLHRV